MSDQPTQPDPDEFDTTTTSDTPVDPDVSDTPGDTVASPPDAGMPDAGTADTVNQTVEPGTPGTDVPPPDTTTDTEGPDTNVDEPTDTSVEPIQGTPQEEVDPADANVREAFSVNVTSEQNSTSTILGDDDQLIDTYEEAVDVGKRACVAENARSFSVNKVFVNDDFAEPVISPPETPVDDTTTPTGTGAGGIIPPVPPLVQPPEPGTSPTTGVDPGQLTGSLSEAEDGTVTGSFTGRP